MRILVAADQWFPDRMGGVARVATDTARGWAARGHEVVAITPCQADHDQESIEEGVTVLRALRRGWLPQTLTDPRESRRVASRFATRRFDVVVAHSCTTAEGLLAAGLDAPLVYVFHASAAGEARDLRGRIRPGRDWISAALLERPLRRFDARALRDAASVLVLSEYSRRVLHETSPAAARGALLVGGAVDTTTFSPEGRAEARERLGVGGSTRLVLTVRRIEPRMGIENLVAASRLLDDVPELRVAIVGSGPSRQLEALRRLSVGGRVSLLGRVSESELPLWYRAADLFVLPTLAYEGFGLVTAEALASGTPVVGTPVGATPELLAPLDPRLVSRGTAPEELAEAIRDGLSLGTFAFRERCREYALARFSWQAVLENWERALEDAARQHGSDRAALVSSETLATADR